MSTHPTCYNCGKENDGNAGIYCFNCARVMNDTGKLPDPHMAIKILAGYMVSKEQWDTTSVAQRVINCHFVNLVGRVAGKEWEQVTADERLSLSGTNILANLLGVKFEPVYEPFAEDIARKARAEHREKLASGMRSITSSIVSRILNPETASNITEE